MNSIIVCGGRDYADAEAVSRYLDRLTKPFVVITGGATGADTLAEQWASRNGMKSIVIPADWKNLGRAAGPIRNRKMLELEPTAVIAFPGGRGTRDMMRAAREAGIPVYEPILSMSRRETEQFLKLAGVRHD